MKLKKLLEGLNCHINLIPLNEIKNCDLKPPTKKDVYSFMNKLENKGLSVTVRRSLGSEIDGACGQLKQSTMESSF